MLFRFVRCKITQFICYTLTHPTRLFILNTERRMAKGICVVGLQSIGEYFKRIYIYGVENNYKKNRRKFGGLKLIT